MWRVHRVITTTTVASATAAVPKPTGKWWLAGRSESATRTAGLTNRINSRTVGATATIIATTGTWRHP